MQSSRRLEREAGRNVEVMWLTGRLVPDHETIAEFRKNNGSAIRRVCARFVMLCRALAEAMEIVGLSRKEFDKADVFNRRKHFFDGLAPTKEMESYTYMVEPWQLMGADQTDTRAVAAALLVRR